VGLSVSNLDRKHQLEHLIGDLQALPVGSDPAGRNGGREVYGALPRCPRRVVVHDIQSALDAV
jgi:hypothetical protein